MYVVISGNEIVAGLPKEDWGTLAVNSSSIFVSSENAGRTGYSWSVMITAVETLRKSLRPELTKTYDYQLIVPRLLGCRRGRYSCSPARSGADLVAYVR